MDERHRKLTACSNCGYVFKDANNFCPECGQKNQELKVPISHMLEELLEGLFHFDSKAFITLKNLILKPGFLSKEYNNGKRVSYVPPFRLYIMISFIFFFLLNVFSTKHNIETETARNKSGQLTLSFNAIGVSTKDLSGLSLKQKDSVMIAKNIPPTNYNKWVINQIYKIANSSAGEFTHSLMKNISYMMFVLMPIFGLLIYLFNKTKMSFSIDGINMSIHFHSFIFLVFTILLILGKVFSFEGLFLFGFLISPIYILIMFKKYFNESVWVVLVKTTGVSIIYFATFCTLLGITIVISIILV